MLGTTPGSTGMHRGAKGLLKDLVFWQRRCKVADLAREPCAWRQRQAGLCGLEASLGHMVRPCPNKKQQENPHRVYTCDPSFWEMDVGESGIQGGQWRAGKMAPWVKVLAANPDDLSSIPRTFTKEGESLLSLGSRFQTQPPSM